MIDLLLLTIENEEQRNKIEKIYNENYNWMLNVAFNITQDQYDAEDAVHSTFVSLIENVDKIKNVARIFFILFF